jgi:O-antigen/teichoic acid export membrane protein
MSREKKIRDANQPDLRKNYIYRMFYEALLFGGPLVTLPYVSRVLGADGIGRYSYSFSIITYFMMFGALGTSSYGTREIARNRNDRQRCSVLFWEIELVSVLSCLVCLIFWGLLVLTAGSDYRLIFFTLTPYLIGTMFDITWFFTGLERIGAIVLANSVTRILGIILIFVTVKSGEDLVIYCLISSGAMLASSLSLWLFLPKTLEKIDFRGLAVRHHVRETLIYFVPAAAASIYLVLDKTLIGLITGNPFQNGYYEQASKIVSVVKALSFTVFNSSVTARLSYLFAAGDLSKIREGIQRSADYILLLSYGSVFGLLGISHTLVPVLFGKGYEPVEALIYLMLPLVPVIGISGCLGNQYYVPAGKRAESSKYIVIGATINLILNLCLIPVWEAKGAVAASVAAELFITIRYMKNCEGFLTPLQLKAFSVKRIPAGAVMAAVVWLLGKLPFNSVVLLLIQVVSGVLIYGLLLIFLKDRLVFELLSQRGREKGSVI